MRNITQPQLGHDAEAGTLGRHPVMVEDQVRTCRKGIDATCERPGDLLVVVLDHATYFPGARPIPLKLLFDLEKWHFLGAQAVGVAGVDQRIDVIVVA